MENVVDEQDKDEKSIVGSELDDADIVPETVKRQVTRWQLEEETRAPVDHEKSAHKVGGRHSETDDHAGEPVYRPGYRHGRLEYAVGGRHRH
jgi:hypothetical protein